MWPIIAAAAAAAGGSMLNYRAQKDIAQDQTNLAYEQMKFQEDMSSTAYQRAVKDMQGAGLNPMLAYQQGGASSPPGAAVPALQAGRPGDVLSSVLSGAQTLANLDKTGAETDLIRRQTETERHRGMDVIEHVGVNIAHGQLLAREAAKVEAETKSIDAARATIYAEFEHKIFQTLRTKFEFYLKHDEWKNLQPQQLRQLIAQAQLLELEIPRALNEAAAEATDFKRYISPFLKDAGTAAGAARDFGIASRGFRGGLTIPRGYR